MMTLSMQIKQGLQRLKEVDSPRLEAELLLAHVLKKDRSYLLAYPERQLSSSELERFEALIERRITGEPIAYLLGEREFWSLSFYVTSSVLIPRPETEQLVEEVLALLRKEHKQYVADLGTGTGAIALAIAHERPHWQITATDISTEALEVARRNAEHHHCHQIHFVQGRWCEALAGAQYDAILSNPPYLAQDDPHLIEGDVRFEPLDALVSGKNGLQDLHCIISQAVSCLKPGGWLLLEHGYNQGAAVREMMMRQGYQTIGTRIDMSGHERVSIGQMPI